MRDRRRSALGLDGDGGRQRGRGDRFLLLLDRHRHRHLGGSGAGGAVAGEVPGLDVVLEPLDVGQRRGNVGGVVAGDDLRGDHLDGDVVAAPQTALAHVEDRTEDAVRVGRVRGDGQRLSARARGDRLVRELWRLAIVGHHRLDRLDGGRRRRGLLLAALLRSLPGAALLALALLLRLRRWLRARVRLGWRCRVGLGHRCSREAQTRGGD